MAEVIRMPLLSDTMTEGKIISWNKKVGDKVKSDDVLAEVETDKATMEYESYNSGTLLYIGAKAKEAVAVNGVLAIIGEKNADWQTLLKAHQAKSATSAKPAVSESKSPASTAPAQTNTSVHSTSESNGRLKASQE